MDDSPSKADEKSEAYEGTNLEKNDDTTENLSELRVYLIFVSLILAAFLVALNGSIVSTVCHQDSAEMIFSNTYYVLFSLPGNPVHHK